MLGQDPDKLVPLWLGHAAPAGVASPMPRGGLFPQVQPAEAATEAEILRARAQSHNHPSLFCKDYVEEVAPAVPPHEGHDLQGLRPALPDQG